MNSNSGVVRHAEPSSKRVKTETGGDAPSQIPNTQKATVKIWDVKGPYGKARKALVSAKTHIRNVPTSERTHEDDLGLQTMLKGNDMRDESAQERVERESAQRGRRSQSQPAEKVGGIEKEEEEVEDEDEDGEEGEEDTGADPRREGVIHNPTPLPPPIPWWEKEVKDEEDSNANMPETMRNVIRAVDGRDARKRVQNPTFTVEEDGIIVVEDDEQTIK